MNMPGWGFPALAAVFFVTSVYGLVGLSHERQENEIVSATNTELRASLDKMQEQLADLSSQLNQRAKLDADALAAKSSNTAESAAKQSACGDDRTLAVAADPVKRVNTPAIKLRPKPRGVAVARAGKPKEDPRWHDMRKRLSAQQEQLNNNTKAIGEARQDLERKLNSTHDELNGANAKNHTELVALEKQGERRYYEFEIDKSKQFQKVGPMGVSLRKVNQKHKYYDVELMVDDQQLEKKHVNLYEPMMIRTADMPQPVEIVVNEIRGDAIKGYISEPKYKKNDLAVMRTTARIDAPKGLQPR